MNEREIEKAKYDKSVYLAVIGQCGTCYYCANACPENAILERILPTINHVLCTRCMKCVEACPRGVLQIIY